MSWGLYIIFGCWGGGVGVFFECIVVVFICVICCIDRGGGVGVFLFGRLFNDFIKWCLWGELLCEVDGFGFEGCCGVFEVKEDGSDGWCGCGWRLLGLVVGSLYLVGLMLKMGLKFCKKVVKIGVGMFKVGEKIMLMFCIVILLMLVLLMILIKNEIKYFKRVVLVWGRWFISLVKRVCFCFWFVIFMVVMNFRCRLFVRIVIGSLWR